MPKVLNTSAQLTCSHGGTITVVASQRSLTAGGTPVLILTDLMAATVSGCPAPCTKVLAVSAGASRTLRAAGTAVVLATVQGTTDQGTFQSLSAGQQVLDAR
ncbi:hypothetical protein [Streptomyces sp. NPDC055189]